MRCEKSVRIRKSISAHNYTNGKKDIFLPLSVTLGANNIVTIRIQDSGSLILLPSTNYTLLYMFFSDMNLYLFLYPHSQACV